MDQDLIKEITNRLTVDVHATAGSPRGAAILSHGFTRSRRTLAGHAQFLAESNALRRK